MKDYTFSNGITLPAGTDVAIATDATHMDDVSTFCNKLSQFVLIEALRIC